MRLIKARQGVGDKIVYINADSICSFYAYHDECENEDRTKIYFENGKCEIEGTHDYSIALFLVSETVQMLDLTEVKYAE